LPLEVEEDDDWLMHVWPDSEFADCDVDGDELMMLAGPPGLVNEK
jgi:hypothetical protein